MAESYSVKAILSATDRGFSSTLKSAIGSVKSLASGAVFGMMTGAGMAAFNALTAGASDLVGEISSSNAAWKTFASNMEIIGAGKGEINAVKKELQSFAEQTVYSSSDMASTYAQLAAVGTKNTAKLVKGFGGLAAAAENPQQAMKTLSQQATQMAAKPAVQWADFKLMLEQTPAGIAAVAKEMGMTTSELVTNVQKGKIKTDEFFDAIQKVGTSDSFTKLATEYKTVGQAMDGLKETVGNKLTPVFDVLSSVGISAISGIVDKLGQIDGEAIASKVKNMVSIAKSYLGVLKNSFSGVGTKVSQALKAVGDVLGLTNKKFSNTTAIKKFSGVMSTVAGAISKVADYISENAYKLKPYIDLISGAIQGIAAAISAAIPYIVQFGKAIADFLLNNSEQICSVLKVAIPAVLGLVGAFKAFNVIKAVIPGVKTFASVFGGLAKASIGNLASRFFKISTATNKVGKSSGASAKQILTLGKSFMMIGAGILMVAAGFALLAQSAIALSNAGGLAIGVMAGLVIAVAGLTLGMMAMMKTVTAGPKKLASMATAMLALGAAVLMIGVGFALMAQSSIALANAGELAIGVMVGMVAAVALLAVGAAALGGALTAGAFGFIAFGAALLLAGAGALMAGAGIKMLASVLPIVAAYGSMGASAIMVLSGAMVVFAAGAILAGAGCAVLGAGLAVAAVGIAAVGVAVAVLSAGVLILALGAAVAAASINLLALALPKVAAYGQSGAAALMILSAGLVVFAAGAAIAGAAAIVLGAGLAVAAAGMTLVGVAVLLAAAGMLVLAAGTLALGAALTLCAASVTMMAAVFPVASTGAMMLAASFTALMGISAALGAALLIVNAPLLLIGASALVASAGILVFGAGMITAAAGTLVMAAALKAVQSSMKSIASSAKTAQSSLKSMQSAVKVVESGLNALGSKAKSAMNKVTSAFNDTASKAQSAGKKVGQGFTQGMQSGLAKAPSVAIRATTTVAATLMAGYGPAYSAGAYISQGFAAGMLSCMAVIEAAAARMAAAAQKALEAKAKIASPSKVTTKDGQWWGQGLANGILDKVSDVKNAAKKLVSIPDLSTPNLAFAYGGEMSADYDYFQNHEYIIEVPLSVDGREFARATASYTQQELNKAQTRDSRKRGKV